MTLDTFQLVIPKEPHSKHRKNYVSGQSKWPIWELIDLTTERDNQLQTTNPRMWICLGSWHTTTATDGSDIGQPANQPSRRCGGLKHPSSQMLPLMVLAAAGLSWVDKLKWTGWQLGPSHNRSHAPASITAFTHSLVSYVIMILYRCSLNGSSSGWWQGERWWWTN